MRGLGQSVAIIRQHYGVLGVLGMWAFIWAGVCLVFALPKWIDDYRWWRIERDIRNRTR